VGRRSRKRRSPERTAAPPAPPRASAPQAAPPVDPRRRPRLEDAPKAPWSPFPLTELCILIAIVLLVLGFVTRGDRGGVELVGGFTLLALSVSELALREHFAGYRSHSAMLAGVGAVSLDAVLFFFTPIPQIVLVAVGVGVFGLLFWWLRAAFMRRTGGVGFRA
jgi:hypothetical protein